MRARGIRGPASARPATVGRRSRRSCGPRSPGTIQGGNVALPDVRRVHRSVLVSGLVLAWQPDPRVPGEDARPALADGLLGGVIPALKISQAQAWVGLLRFRPRGRASRSRRVRRALAIAAAARVAASALVRVARAVGAGRLIHVGGCAARASRPALRRPSPWPSRSATMLAAAVRSPAPRRAVDRPPHRDRRADAANARRAVRDPRDARGPPRDRAAGGHPGGDLHVRRDVARPGARYHHEHPRDKVPGNSSSRSASAGAPAPPARPSTPRRSPFVPPCRHRTRC